MRLILCCLILLASCATADPGLPGWTGLEHQIESYYRDRAQEEGATCNLPRMVVVKTDILEQTADRLSLDVQYFWRDNTYGDPSDGGGCFGSGERRFEVSRTTDNRYSVVSMSGAQR